MFLHPPCGIRRNSEPPQAALSLSDAVEHLGEVLGPDHPNTKIFRNNLASAYQAAGRSEDATALFDPPPDSGAADADRPDE